MELGFEPFAVLGLWMVFLFFILIAVYILNSLGLYKIFKKANSKGWAAFVPYFNDWTLIEISGCHWWYFLIIIGNTVLNVIYSGEMVGILGLISSLLSLLSLYIVLCINYNVAKKFDQGIGFAIGMTLVPLVFYLVLGFSEKYQYNSNVKVNPWGLYDFDKKTFDLKQEKIYCTECGTQISGNFCPKCGNRKKGE